MAGKYNEKTVDAMPCQGYVQHKILRVKKGLTCLFPCCNAGVRHRDILSSFERRFVTNTQKLPLLDFPPHLELSLIDFLGSVRGIFVYRFL